jgi:hypothetical protein
LRRSLPSGKYCVLYHQIFELTGREIESCQGIDRKKLVSPGGMSYVGIIASADDPGSNPARVLGSRKIAALLLLILTALIVTFIRKKINARAYINFLRTCQKFEVEVWQSG